MKAITMLCLICILVNPTSAQVKEFEGIIEYKISFHFKESGLDTVSIMKDYGTVNTFYYKEGNYRWESNSAKLDVEYFDSRKQTVFFLFKNNDTLFQSREGGYDDSLIEFKHLTKRKLICGLKCTGVATTVFTKNSDGSLTKRNLYFSESLAINPIHFQQYKTFGSNKVYQQIKSWPLWIELDSENIPFSVVMEATKIIPKQLDLVDILPPSDKQIKKMVF